MYWYQSVLKRITWRKKWMGNRVIYNRKENREGEMVGAIMHPTIFSNQVEDY